MATKEIIDELKSFIAGNIRITDLNELIDDWLFELRGKPGLTSDQELLSSLELYLHEAREGYRSWDELRDLVVSIIQRNLSEYYTRTITLPSSYTANLGTVTQAIPVKDYSLGRVIINASVA